MPTDFIVLGIIVVIVVLIWRGPKILPEWGAAIGKGVREARNNATKGLDDKKPTELSDGGVDTSATAATTAPTARQDTTNAPRP